LAARRLQLLPGEEVLVDIRPHWSYLSGPLVLSLAAVAIGIALDVGIPHTSVALHWVEGAVVAVPCAWLAVRVVRWRTTGLVLTPLRIVEYWGVVSRREWEIRLSRIESTRVVQSPFRRLVGTGRLELVYWVEDEDEVRWIEDVRKPVILQRIVNRRMVPPPDPGVGSA
jgi:hypothetical protein